MIEASNDGFFPRSKYWYVNMISTIKYIQTYIDDEYLRWTFCSNQQISVTLLFDKKKFNDEKSVREIKW